MRIGWWGRTAAAVVGLMVVLPCAGEGGQAKPAAPPPAPAVAAPPPAPTQAVPETYSYDPKGRRDPFVSLVARAADERPAGKKVEGLGGLAVVDITLRGILQSRGAFIAMVQGPDKKTWVVHPNDRLADGIVRAITADTLIILQEVNDPLSLTKQREIRKSLRVLEEVK
jgi:Tfp pilus assembly protein PilP